MMTEASICPTTHWPAWRSGPLYIGVVRLPLGSVHDGPPKDTLQLFGVWWGDRVATDGQLHQGQTHAPHVRLNGVVSALQSLRLLRNTQPTSAGREAEPRRQAKEGREGGREVCAEGSVRGRHRKWKRG